MACAVGLVYLKLRQQPLGPLTRPILKNYLWMASLHSLASPFGYASLKHIDYPTMILGKSCKLVPVMLMSVVLHRAKFPRFQIVSVFLVTLGVSLFMLFHEQERMDGKKASTRVNSLWGLFLLSINLLIDGVTNSTQDAMFRQFKVNGQQMMVMMNFLSSLLMIGFLCIPSLSGGELNQAMTFVQTHPSILYDIGLFSLAGALGQVFIFHTLSRFGSLSLVTITVTRKMFSIILSVFLYHHHVSLLQWGCVLIVFAGIVTESYGKAAQKKNGKKTN
jgi:UDP-galactose transporter B1